MSWSADTLNRLERLKSESDAANQASKAAFERLHALGRELLAQRGNLGVSTHAVNGGRVAYAVSMRDARCYYREEITSAGATLALTGPRDDDPPPDELGARCHAAWSELTILGAGANEARDRLEAALREAVGA